jgi:hypothetical protein
MSNSPTSSNEVLHGSTVNAIGEGSGNGNFTMNDTVGAAFLGLVAIISLIAALIMFIALQRAHARNRFMLAGMLPANKAKS